MPVNILIYKINGLCFVFYLLWFPSKTKLDALKNTKQAKNGHWIRSMWETLQQRGGKKKSKRILHLIPLQVSLVDKKGKKLENAFILTMQNRQLWTISSVKLYSLKKGSKLYIKKIAKQNYTYVFN